jgi:hypothetical protein
MKTTRILGIVAGVTAVVALITIGFGTLAGLTKLGMVSLLVGLGVMAVSLLVGIAHLLMRIKFRNPYRSRRGPKAFLKAGRILMWVWGVAMIVTGAMVAYLAAQLGPALFSLL